MKNTIEKAKNIRLAIFDVDGVLTNGKLIYGPDGLEYKEFHVHDGQGIKFLQATGVEVAIITACQSKAITKRMQDLGIKHVYQGNLDKIPAFEDLKQKLNLHNEQIAYMGDDLPDLPLILQAGLGATVANAPTIIQQHAAWIAKAPGGYGAARELCELIMQAQQTYDAIINSYIERARPLTVNEASNS